MSGYLGMSKPVTRKLLVQVTRTNTTIRLTWEMIPTAGEKEFRAPSSSTPVELFKGQALWGRGCVMPHVKTAPLNLTPRVILTQTTCPLLPRRMIPAPYKSRSLSSLDTSRPSPLPFCVILHPNHSDFQEVTEYVGGDATTGAPQTNNTR